LYSISSYNQKDDILQLLHV